jgi:HTH-type transcriptional regulator, glycine betaine synthesis regulator
MDQSLAHGASGGIPVSPNAEALIRRFVEHWGMMARAWGINATMGELFALLYITDADWTAEDLRSWLKVSRGNVSMNLRELLAWGVVRKIHRAGERRELYHAETDVWTLFRRILTERKRRELDPTLTVLDSLAQHAEEDPELGELRSRVEPLRQFFGMIDGLSARLMALEARDVVELSQILTMDDVDGSSEETGDSV